MVVTGWGIERGGGRGYTLVCRGEGLLIVYKEKGPGFFYSKTNILARKFNDHKIVRCTVYTHPSGVGRTTVVTK